jgi:hypothetical protein
MRNVFNISKVYELVLNEARITWTSSVAPTGSVYMRITDVFAEKEFDIWVKGSVMAW